MYPHDTLSSRIFRINCNILSFICFKFNILDFLMLPHTKGQKKHLEKDLCDGFATISDVDVVLLNQIYMLLSLLLSPSLAHLEGSAIIRRSPNKSKLKQASATIAIEKQSKLTDSVKASRTLTQSAADAYGSISPWGWLMCVCFFVSGKLIYYYSHPAPLHALLSICTVVLAVCSNLLLF